MNNGGYRLKIAGIAEIAAIGAGNTES